MNPLKLQVSKLLLYLDENPCPLLAHRSLPELLHHREKYEIKLQGTNLDHLVLIAWNESYHSGSIEDVLVIPLTEEMLPPIITQLTEKARAKASREAQERFEKQMINQRLAEVGLL